MDENKAYMFMSSCEKTAEEKGICNSVSINAAKPK